MISPISMFSPRKTTVGFLSLDVLINENLKLPSEVTKYPIEDGTEITDHITQLNEELQITGRVSSSEVLSFEFGTCVTKLIDAIDQLRSMHKARESITVVTGLGQYTEMAFTSLSVTRSNGADGGSWLDINADLRKLKKVSLKQTELPPDKANAGTKGKTGNTKQAAKTSGNTTPPKNQSILKGLQNQTNTYRPGTIPVGPKAAPGSVR